MSSSPGLNHLSQTVLCQFLDDELTANEQARVEAHLAICDVCRQQWISLKHLSAEIENAVATTWVPVLDDIRPILQARSQKQSLDVKLERPGKVMQRFGWGMGIAATLAFGVLMIPRSELMPKSSSIGTEQLARTMPTSLIEVDGETFHPVPYSNSELTTSAPHIVQMQVSVSSLADIGLVLDPVASFSGGEAERSVLADVLVGADGQPRGVHVYGLD